MEPALGEKKKIFWPGSSLTHYNVLTFRQQLFPKWQRKNSALQLLTKFDFLYFVLQTPPRTTFSPKPIPQFSWIHLLWPTVITFLQMWNLNDSHATPVHVWTCPLMSMLYAILLIAYSPFLWLFKPCNLWLEAQAVTCVSALLPTNTFWWHNTGSVWHPSKVFFDYKVQTSLYVTVYLFIF